MLHFLDMAQAVQSRGTTVCRQQAAILPLTFEEREMSGKMKTMDGNAAAAWISYAFTDVAAIYPITPSTPMAENVDEWTAQGKKNLFGQPVRLMEMQIGRAHV